MQALPWLLLVATLALAFGRRVTSAFRGWGGAGGGVILSGQFILGIYEGYFGGAVGIIMMALWSLATKSDITRLQSLRAMLVTAANTSATLLFAATRAVDWWAALLLAPAALIGGYVDALLGIRLPSALVRAITLALARLVPPRSL